MKKLILYLLFFALAVNSFAQEKPKQKEVGLAFYGLNGFGITYKIGKSNSLWRLSSLYTSGNARNEQRDSLDVTSSRNGFGVGIGREYRSLIDEKLELRYGFEIGFDWNKNTSTRNDKSSRDGDTNFQGVSYGPKLSVVIGLNYIINDKIIIGAELLPNVRYWLVKNKEENFIMDTVEERTTKDLSYGLSNSSALLTLSYRF